VLEDIPNLALEHEKTGSRSPKTITPRGGEQRR
jgi:hypothetical protein